MDNGIIGTHVRYFDYLGFERFGTICHYEFSNMNPNMCYVYISDEDQEFNVHQLMCPDGKVIYYAEIRLSNEVSVDSSKPVSNKGELKCRVTKK